MTGARDVIEDAAFGFLSSHCLSGGRKPPILSREVREQNNDTGKICLSARAEWGTAKLTQARVNAQTAMNVTQDLTNSER